jgi:hypothetical protein
MRKQTLAVTLLAVILLLLAEGSLAVQLRDRTKKEIVVDLAQIDPVEEQVLPNFP